MITTMITTVEIDAENRKEKGAQSKGLGPTDTDCDRPTAPPPPTAKIRVDNLHWELTEDDIYV